jgi:hypothetical protein
MANGEWEMSGIQHSPFAIQHSAFNASRTMLEVA